MYVTTSLVLAIVDELQRQGVRVEAFCESAAIDPAELRGLRVRIDTYDRAVRAARTLSKNPALGLRVGGTAPAGALNVVGYLLATCGTIRDAFSQFVEYSTLIKQGARWRLIEDGHVAQFHYEHPIVAPDNVRFDAEACLSLVLKIGRQFVGNEIPDVVRFRHAAPSYAAEYGRVFDCQVLFEQPSNEIVFARRHLDRAQVHRDDRLRELLRGRATELLAHRFSEDALVMHLCELLRIEATSRAPSAERLARGLGVTRRTLERRLGLRGLSLAAMMEDARRDAACIALRATNESIKRVAYRMGFSEPSAFHRAFKRWTGSTPGRYRADARAAERPDDRGRRGVPGTREPL